MRRRLLSTLAFASVLACVERDAMVASEGRPGFNVFLYRRCGIAVSGNGSRAMPSSLSAADRADLAHRLGDPKAMLALETAPACHDDRHSVLRVVLGSWAGVGDVVDDFGAWLVAHDFRGEIDVGLASPNGPPPTLGSLSKPMPFPGPCTVASSGEGYTVYSCPSCGTAVVGAGSRTFDWRADGGAPELPGVGSSRGSGISLGCRSKSKTPLLLLGDSSRAAMDRAARAAGEWLASGHYGEEIDLIYLPEPRLLDAR